MGPNLAGVFVTTISGGIMLALLVIDTCALLNARGFAISPHIGEPGHYVIERAFVKK